MKKDNENNATTGNSNQKTKIYNLVILDKSGSMTSIAQGAVMGFNETLHGIRKAQEMYKDTQEHYVSLLVFCNCEKKYLYDKVPVTKVTDLKMRQYHPCCSTPLYDAMGFSLNALLKDIQNLDDATAVVTVITDGMENASHEYSGSDIKALVERLTDKEGWTFSYIGANQDVEAVGATLSIKATMSFDYDNEGMRHAFDREMNARMRNYERYSNAFKSCQNMSIEEKKKYKANLNRKANWYLSEDDIKNRITPEHITQLKDNEILVFGSNNHGRHSGGMAQTALLHFGAILGQAVGLQGQSYAIPTTGVHETEMANYISDFIQFAQLHPELKFYVPAIGCGHAGYSVEQMARMFVRAQEVQNICLPESFWNVIL